MQTMWACHFKLPRTVAKAKTKFIFIISVYWDGSWWEWAHSPWQLCYRTADDHTTRKRGQTKILFAGHFHNQIMKKIKYTQINLFKINIKTGQFKENSWH